MAAERGPAESIEELVARHDLSRVVAKAMEQLPEEQRTAIILKEYHGMTFQEIADLQGCPLSTVKTRLYQGLIVLAAAPAARGTRSFGDGAVMAIVMRCDEKERLVGYLYEECSAAERSAVEAHLARCAVCAAELDGLRDVQGTWPTGTRPRPTSASVLRGSGRRPVTTRQRGPCRRGPRPQQRCWCLRRAPAWRTSRSSTAARA